MAKSKKKTVSRSRVAALLVILVLLAAVSLEVARVYGSRLPELRSKSQALDAQIQQTEKQNVVLRSDLGPRGGPGLCPGSGPGRPGPGLRRRAHFLRREQLTRHIIEGSR